MGRMTAGAARSLCGLHWCMSRHLRSCSCLQSDAGIHFSALPARSPAKGADEGAAVVGVSRSVSSNLHVPLAAHAGWLSMGRLLRTCRVVGLAKGVPEQLHSYAGATAGRAEQGRA